MKILVLKICERKKGRRDCGKTLIIFIFHYVLFLTDRKELNYSNKIGY